MDNFLYILYALIAFILFSQLYIRLSTYFKKGKILDDIPGKLGKEIGKGKKKLLYFYSSGCAACKPMTPVIDKMQKEYKNLHMINVATEMDIAKKIGVMGTPALVLVENNKISSFQLGAKNEPAIRKLLDL